MADENYARLKATVPTPAVAPGDDPCDGRSITVLIYAENPSSRIPGLRLIIPVVDVQHHMLLRVVTMPIQS